MIYAIIGVGILVVVAVILIIFKPFKRVEKDDCLHLWGNVEEGWQYCTKCGAARVAGCVHEWKELHNHNITRGTDNGVIGNELMFECKKCTQRKYVRTSLDGEPIVKLI